MQTQVHILSSGENSALLAQKYHMTLEELRKLNQFRTFAHGFKHLQPGDELDVPLAPLPEIIWNDATISKAAEQRDDGQLQEIASLASQMWDFLSNNPTGDTAANRARGTVNSVVSGKTQQWLNQFGTARVQFDTDKNFSLKNSQFDLVVPLYEQGIGWFLPKVACTALMTEPSQISGWDSATFHPATCWAAMFFVIMFYPKNTYGQALA